MKKTAILTAMSLAFAFSLSAKTVMLFDFESDDDLKKIELTNEPIRVNPVTIGGIPGQDAAINCDPVKDFDATVIPYAKVTENATSGKSSLKVTDKPKAGNMHFINFPKDWTNCGYLKMDIFNPGSVATVNIVITDTTTRTDPAFKNSLGAYPTRADFTKILKAGKNSVELELDGLTCNDKSRSMDLKNMLKLAIDMPNKAYTVDNIRLESED